MTKENPAATYACLNLGQAEAPAEIRRQAICLDADAGKVIGKLRF